MSIDPTCDPHARIVVKPLPSQVAAAKAKAAESAEAAGGFGTAGIGVGSAGGVGAAGVGATAAGGPVPPPSASPRIAPPRVASDDPFLRAANEDDDGYDPYSDRPAPPEPLFQEDPWA